MRCLRAGSERKLEPRMAQVRDRKRGERGTRRRTWILLGSRPAPCAPKRESHKFHSRVNTRLADGFMNTIEFFTGNVRFWLRANATKPMSPNVLWYMPCLREEGVKSQHYNKCLSTPALSMSSVQEPATMDAASPPAYISTCLPRPAYRDDGK